MSDFIDGWFDPEDAIEGNYKRYMIGHPDYGLQDDFELQMRKFKVYRRVIVLDISHIDQSRHAVKSVLQQYGLPIIGVILDPYFNRPPPPDEVYCGRFRQFPSDTAKRYLIKFEKKVSDEVFVQICEEISVIDDS